MDLERRPIRFSARHPPRYAAGMDFRLWIERVELYMWEVGISEGKKGQELVSLLEDEPFRMVSQLGLLGDGTVDYAAAKTLEH